MLTNLPPLKVRLKALRNLSILPNLGGLYVPYAGATTDVDLGAHSITAANFIGPLQGNADTATLTATSTIVDDTTTNATMYPVWVTAASGGLPLKVSSTKISFNPFTGFLATDTATQAPLDNSNKLASTAYVDTAMAAVDDFLSGVYYIAFGDTKTIPIYKQMITKENLYLSGTLVVNGQYFLEA